MCRTALSRGMQVISIRYAFTPLWLWVYLIARTHSPSGKPWHTPKGHTPAWVSKVWFHIASALPQTLIRHHIAPARIGRMV